MIRRFARDLLGVDREPAAPPRWWIVVIVFAVATLLALFRVPMASWNVLWAEDGAVFINHALGGDPLVFVQAYAGYLHVVPRILAAITVTVSSLEAIPTVMLVLAAITVGLLAAALFTLARTRLSSIAVCALLALQVAVLPIAGGEVALSVANLHWYLIFSAFWAAAVTPRTRALTVVQCLVVGFAILSDPLAALLVSPLVLARIIGIRPFRGRAHAVTWTFLGTSIVQGTASFISVVVLNERGGSSVLPTLSELSGTYGERVILNSLTGVSGTVTLVNSLGPLAVLAGAIIAALIVGIAAWRDSTHRWLVLAFAAASVAFFVVVLFAKWDGFVGPFGGVAPGGRYLVVPVFLLFSAYALAVDSYARLLTPRRLAWVPIVALAAIVVIPGAVDYRMANVRASATSWTASLAEAAKVCEADPTAATAPGALAPPGFGGGVPIPCDKLVAK